MATKATVGRRVPTPPQTARVMVLPRPGKARRTGAQAWIERTNPLTRLSLRAAQSIYDTARGGGYTRLQYIYAEIEKTDPTLFTCVDRRLSALSALGWRVVANVEGAEAEAQKKKLEEMLDGAVGLSAAIEHMGLAFFRGFSFCEPYMRDGRLAFNCPPSWEFNRSPDGTWWHNPLVIEGDAGGGRDAVPDPANESLAKTRAPPVRRSPLILTAAVSPNTAMGRPAAGAAATDISAFGVQQRLPFTRGNAPTASAPFGWSIAATKGGSNSSDLTFRRSTPREKTAGAVW